MSPAANLVCDGDEAPEIALTERERAKLELRAACYTRAHKEVQWAKIILYAADGLSNVEIAKRRDSAPEVVGRWRKRFHRGAS